MNLFKMMCVCFIYSISAWAIALSEIYHTAFDSEMTCRNRCGDLADTSHICSCDEKCYNYGDCCFDYFLECSGIHRNGAREKNISDFSKWTKTALTHFKQHNRVSKCLSLSKNPRRKVLGVSFCARKFKNKDHCERPDVNNLTDFTPVYDTKAKLFYRNIFCAICNGVPKCSSQLASFETKVKRSRYTSCKISPEMPGNINWLMNDSRCFVEPLWSVYECPLPDVNRFISALCSAIIAPVTTKDSSSSRVFKNAFCAFCQKINVSSIVPFSNNITFPSDPLGFESPSGHGKPYFRYTFRQLFDFSNNYIIKIVPNSLDDKRRKWYKLHGTKNKTARLSIGIESSSVDAIQSFISRMSDITFNLTRRNITSECNSLNSSTHYTLHSTEEVETVALLYNVSEFLRCNSANAIHYFEILELDNIQDCESTALQLVKNHNIENITDYIEDSTNRTIIVWKRIGCDGSKLSPFLLSFVCPDFPLAGCTHVAVNKTLTTVEDQIHFLLKKNRNFSRSLLYKENGTFIHVVCHPPGNGLTADPTAALIDIICLTISLGTLILTLGTYIALKCLRTRAGIYCMNLVFSMICWHILYLLFVSDDIPLPTGLMCKVLGYVRLYFFMVIFFWQTYLAVDLAWNLTHVFRRHSKQVASRKLVVSAVICWGVPLLLNVTTGALSYVGVIDTVFSVDNGCGVYAKNDLYLCLQAPIVLGLVISFVCFFVSFVVLYKNRKAVGKLQVTHVKQGEPLTCVKISILVGLPWVLIILGNATEADIVWRTGTSICTCQGFLLSLVLLANKKVYTVVRSFYMSKLVHVAQ